MEIAMTIREMEARDVPAVARLSEEAFRETYPFDWEGNAKALHEGTASGRVSVLVAEAGGAVVGYGNLRGWPAGGWIDQVVVSGSHRRSGVGRAIVESLVAAARSRGWWKVSLIVSAADPRAAPFFRACGFETVGPMRDEIRSGVDGILLSRVVDMALHPNP